MMAILIPSILLCGAGMLLFFGGKRARSTEAIAVSLLQEEVVSRVVPFAAEAKWGVVEARRIGSWLLGALAFWVVRVWMGKESLAGDLVFAVLGALAAELFYRAARRREAREELQRLERNLPVVIERVVMAAGAGLDVLPAIGEAAGASDDPVSSALRRVVELSERGLPVDEALRFVSTSLPSRSVRHAFVHFGLAHKQGGEIVRPLRELSDATQLHYQELIEEEIARLPARAVFPLVVIFAGLIICFLTVPLIQVGSITSRVTTAARGGS